MRSVYFSRGIDTIDQKTIHLISLRATFEMIELITMTEDFFFREEIRNNKKYDNSSLINFQRIISYFHLYSTTQVANFFPAAGRTSCSLIISLPVPSTMNIISNSVP